jgi:hypothetical protein
LSESVNAPSHKKPNYVSKVLQLMDQDYDYGEAVDAVLKDNPDLDRDHLEEELDDWI